jgi:tripartite-type tricarboxylate transporter receptor subunit TctC
MTMKPILMAVAAGAMAGVPWDSAAIADVSFKGKAISMVIGSETGGGTDATGRLVGPFFEKYLPGNPTIVVRNMPGAQGVTALNYIVQQTKPDGLTLITGANVQASPLTYRKANGIYDPTKFRYVGGIGRGGTVLMINKDAEKRLYDKSQPPLFYGVLDGTRASEQVSIWGIEYLGWNAKVVVGYRGTSAVMLAMERGEVDMGSTGSAFHIKNLIDSGKFRVLGQSGTLEDGRFAGRPDFGDAPVFANVMHEKLTDPVARQAFSYWEAINAMDKWVGLAEGTPEDIVETYREAFKKTVADPDFLERGAKISEDILPMSYRDVELLVRQLASATEDAEEFIRELQRKQGIRVK